LKAPVLSFFLTLAHFAKNTHVVFLKSIFNLFGMPSVTASKTAACATSKTGLHCFIFDPAAVGPQTAYI
jgi:hypothetical protein